MKALVVEQSPGVVKTVAMALGIRWPAVEVVSAAEGCEGVELAEAESPDIVIVDTRLPDMDGFQVLRQIRLFSDVPIIILDSKGEEADKVKGFGFGADDYVTRPFGFLEFVCRVKSVLDHHYASQTAFSGGTFDSGALHIDFDLRQVLVHGTEVALTPCEYELLCGLVQSAGRVLRLPLLARIIQREGRAGKIENLKVHIRRLRAKIEDDPSNPRFILTHRGVGYRFARPDR